MRQQLLPPTLYSEAFSVADAIEHGVTEKRLRGRDLRRPHRGVRSTAPEGETTLKRCFEFEPVLLKGQAFSHLTAARLWGLPVPHEFSDALHVIAYQGFPPRRPGIVGHASSTGMPMSHASVELLAGMPVVDPVWAWAQCSELLGLDALVAMGDALAGRWSSHPTARERPRSDLGAAVTAWAGQRGVKRLRAAFDLVRANVWSPKETELRLLLTRSGLPEPAELNADVFDDDGRWLGCVDVLYRDDKLAIEYEGDHHRVDRRQWRRDITRYERFADAGWRIIRVTDDDLSSPAELVERISRILATGALQ